MKIIKAGYEIITPINKYVMLRRLEEIGRVSYKSENRITEESAPKFIKARIEEKHEPVLEHISLSVKFICDRGVSHEIVRHRLASYMQESTRYCNYSKDQFDNEITVIAPCFLNFGEKDDEEIRRAAKELNLYFPDKSYINENTQAWYDAMLKCEEAYFEMLDGGLSPQEARSVLPNSLKTELVMTTNITNWRHFFRLRTAKAAHPQMREITIPLLNELKQKLPELFEDIEVGL